MVLRPALAPAFVSDMLSIVTMEVIDNAVMLMIPGAAGGYGPGDSLIFRCSLGFSLVLAVMARRATASPPHRLSLRAKLVNRFGVNEEMLRCF